MARIQGLKKQLRGIRSTQKLTEAMKAVSTMKFSKLNGLYGRYSEYGKQCRQMFDTYGTSLLDAVGVTDSTAPPAVLVLAGNKGLCGSFNTELLGFAYERIAELDSPLLVACGKKAEDFFHEKALAMEEAYSLDDVPTYEESARLLDRVMEWRRTGKVSDVHVIYAHYTNMLKQSPAACNLFAPGSRDAGRPVLFVPDRETIVETSAKTVFRAMFYQLVLETALGVQAATLMTMRSAYDTATEYCTQLEWEINRKRQSAVTADVLETSSERGEDEY